MTFHEAENDFILELTSLKFLSCSFLLVSLSRVISSTFLCSIPVITMKRHTKFWSLA